MDNDKKFCAVSLASEDGCKCLEEKCMWWSEDHQKCAVLLLAEKKGDR